MDYKSRKLLVLPPIVVGLLVLGGVLRSRSEPVRAAAEAPSTPVRVIAVPKLTLVPRSVGYGVAKPVVTWRAVAEVSGQATRVHPSLRPGAFLREGTVLVELDPTRYRLAIDRAQADLGMTAAELEKLEVSEKSDQALLGLEERALQLAEAELERAEQLARSGPGSAAGVDLQRRQVVGQRLKHQSMTSRLATYPSQRSLLAARKAQGEVAVATAKLDLERCVIKAPFTCRVAEVGIEQAQFATRGQVLVVADGVDATEVAAQFPIEKLAWLLPAGTHPPGTTVKIPASTVNTPDLMSLIEGAKAASIFKLEARVRIHTADLTFEWEARFARSSSELDPVTRSLAAVVVVDDPYRKAIPGRTPPLWKGMYCEVELSGPPREGTVIVPRAALHGDVVYLVGDKGDLVRRHVTVGYGQGSFVAIASGLEGGERLVVTDVQPAISGMLLSPVEDEALAAAIRAEASGASSVR